MVILRASRTDAPQCESNADSPLLISSIENSTLRHFHQVEKWGLIRSRICRTRTHDFQSWGRGFESLRAHQANQAQLEFMLPSPDLLGSAWEAGPPCRSMTSSLRLSGSSERAIRLVATSSRSPTKAISSA